jgi:phosphatidylinositol alpha-mannosyltransferase
MALGKPIVASSNPGYASVVKDGEHALMVPPHNSVALAGALRCLINDKELRTRMGINGLNTVQQYDWPVVAKRILDYYEKTSRGKLSTHDIGGRKETADASI